MKKFHRLESSPETKEKNENPLYRRLSQLLRDTLYVEGMVDYGGESKISIQKTGTGFQITLTDRQRNLVRIYSVGRHDMGTTLVSVDHLDKYGKGSDVSPEITGYLKDTPAVHQVYVWGYIDRMRSH